MNLLYVLNILFLLFISFYPTYYLTRFYRFGILNPISLELIVNSPVSLSTFLVGPLFLIDDGLFDPYYNFAILVTNISLICKFFLVVIILKFLDRRRCLLGNFSMPAKFRLKKEKVFGFGMVFLCLFVISFVMLSSEFGLSNWLKAPREGYQYYRAGAGQWFGLSITFLSLSYTLVTLCLRKIRSIGIVFGIYACLAYFLGTKGIFLAMAQYILVLLWIRRYEHLTRLLIVLVPSAFVMMLINYFSQHDQIELVNALTYFDHFQHSAWYYEAFFKGEIPLYYGEIFTSNLWGLIPRALYEQKPYIYGITIINEYFWPGMAELTVTPAFGGPVELFADFGIFGVIILSFFNIGIAANTIFSYFLYKNILVENVMQNPWFLYLFLWFYAPWLLVVFPFPLNIIIFITIIMTIHAGNRIIFKF